MCAYRQSSGDNTQDTDTSVSHLRTRIGVRVCVSLAFTLSFSVRRVRVNGVT